MNKEILICATHKQLDYLRSRYGFDLDDLYAQELVTEKIVRDAIHLEGELRVFFVLHPQKSIRQRKISEPSRRRQRCSRPPSEGRWGSST